MSHGILMNKLRLHIADYHNTPRARAAMQEALDFIARIPTHDHPPPMQARIRQEMIDPRTSGVSTVLPVIQQNCSLPVPVLSAIRNRAAYITDEWAEHQSKDPSRAECEARFVSEIVRMVAAQR